MESEGATKNESGDDWNTLTDALQNIYPEENLDLLKEFGADIDRDSKDNPDLFPKKEEAISCLRNLVESCKTSERFTTPFTSLSEFKGIVGTYYNKWRWQNRPLRVILIGETGTGKSTLGNVLLEGRGEEERFATGAEADPCTVALQEEDGHWLGIRAQTKVTIIDTPGLNDPNLSDEMVVTSLLKSLEDMKYMSAFIMVFNGATYRFTKAHWQMINAYRSMFHLNIFTNIIVVFTHWPKDEASASRRKLTGDSEESRKSDFMKKIASIFCLDPEFKIPCFFLDCCDYKTERGAHKEHEETLKDLITCVENFTPFCTINPEELKQKENLIVESVRKVMRKAEAAKNTNSEQREKLEDVLRQARRIETESEWHNRDASNRNSESVRSRTILDRSHRSTPNRVIREAEERIARQERVHEGRGFFDRIIDSDVWSVIAVGGVALLTFLLARRY